MQVGPATTSASSARRRPPSTSSVLLWVVALVVILVVVLVVIRKEPEAPSPIVPTPTAVPVEKPVPVVPSPTPTAAPAPTAIPTFEPDPTPTPTLIPIPTRRPAKVPEESLQCASFRWMITPNMPGLGHNVVEIQVTNNCHRDLEPDDLWFEISGMRDGGLVHNARAKPFEGAKRRGTVTLTVDLPGSVDWYDDIQIRHVGR